MSELIVPATLPTEEELTRLKLAAELRYITAKAEREEYLANESRLATDYNASLDRNNCVYNFLDTVDTETVTNALLMLNAWDRQHPIAPFTVRFNSPGGSVIDGLALYDTLLDIRQRHHVTTHARGMAASMGGILLQAGDERVIAPNAYMMIHEISFSVRGKSSDIGDMYEFGKRMQDRCLGILAERSTLSKEEIGERWQRKDWWLDAHETVELGFADRIG